MIEPSPFVCEHEDCNLIYQDPITLPCGNTLCKIHLDKQNKTFKCYFCRDEHEIPENGFAVSKTILNMIEYYYDTNLLTHNKTNKLRKRIKETFKILDDSIKDYEKLDPEVYIYDYFAELRNKVDLHREELFKEINERADEIIKQLKEKEEKCKSNSNNLEKMNLNKLKDEELATFKHKLRIAEINQNELNDLLLKINEHVKTIQNENKKYKKDLLINESIEFKNHEKSSSFGELFFNYHTFPLSYDCGELIREFNQHSDSIASIEVDEKSNKMISASDDNTIKIWDLESGDCLKTLTDHQDWVNCIIIIPGDKFISGANDETVKIWDMNSNECLNTLVNESSVHSLCLISNDKIAVGCRNGSIIIWNFDNIEREEIFEAHDDVISYLLYVDNSKLISCSWDYKIKLWDFATFECIIEFEGHSDSIYHLDLTSNRNLISCSKDQTVKLWDIETGIILKSIEFNKEVYHVKKLSDDLILAALEEGEIQIYSLKKNEIAKTISAHSSPVFILHLLSNGNLLSGSENGEIKLWKILE
jgi:aspartate 1-decarboxylase